jgi:hypothetical protein
MVNETLTGVVPRRLVRPPIVRRTAKNLPPNRADATLI